MDMDTMMFRSATDARCMLQRREVSSLELTSALLDRIDAVNPALNAVVEFRQAAALAEAAEADAATARGEPVGPLHGLPMTIKDSFNVTGLH